MSEYYKIGLLPDETTAALLIDNANLLRPHTNGYLLGDNAMAHITVCQFKAEVDQIEALQHALKELPQAMTLKTLDITVRAGTDTHLGFDWIETGIESEPDLWTLQKSVYAILKDNKCDPITDMETYSPHITYGRVASNMGDEYITSRLKDIPTNIATTLALGHSTVNGEWIKTISTF